MQPKDEAKGWLTFAQNSADTNYVDLAYLLALSIKATCKHNRFAIAVDEESESNINTRQRKVFDHIIVVPHMEPFYNETLALDITPFKETFKVESDMIVPRNLDHWWNGCRIQDVCYTNNVRDYRGNIATSRKYRKFFDANYLDDAYNGIYDKPDTDVLYGLAQQHLGLPCSNNLSYPTFTHMKPAINGWKESVKWQDAVPWTLTNDFDFIVGGYAQQYPFHYYDKTFCTPELTDRYEQRVRTSTN